MMNKRLIAGIFLLSFFYLWFFTQDVPFFWDDHEFHHDFAKHSYADLAKEVFSPNTHGLTYNTRPVYGIAFKVMYALFSFEYGWYRIAKALVFAGACVLIFSIAFFLLEQSAPSLVATALITFSFPWYQHTLVFDEPFIGAEFFKLAALLLFLYDFKKEKTSMYYQCTIFFFSLLAIRTYFPAFSIAGILPLFTLITDHKKFSRYVPLFIAIILIQFPFGGGFSDAAFTPKLTNLEKVVFNDFSRVIFNPIPPTSSLYYLPLTAILTFAGVWCTLFLLGYVLFSDLRNRLNHQIFILSGIWLLAEIPVYIFLPEHAIRYTSALLVPLMLLIVGLGWIVAEKNPHIRSILALALLSMLLINIGYVYLFRATWGSSFFAMENTMDYLAEHHETPATALYYAGSVASEYFFMNKSNPNYVYGVGLSYKKTTDLNNFSKPSSANESLYFLQRFTSFSGASYPAIVLEDRPDLVKIATIEGQGRTLFDTINNLIVRLFNIPYNPNKVIIYKFREDI